MAKAKTSRDLLGLPASNPSSTPTGFPNEIHFLACKKVLDRRKLV